MHDDLIRRILTARVYDVAVETPLELARNLSSRLDNTVYLKREDLQPVFSFKLRGAYNKMAQLTAAERARGVVAASAGNHAQGVALAGSRLGIRTLIVMPKTTPEIKVKAVQSLGGTAVLHGNNYDEAYAHARALEREQGMAFVHPFDDWDVIAGQGTIGMEILRQSQQQVPDAVFLCVGGGGLVAGVGSYLKYLYPHIRIIGVEHEEAPSMYQSLQVGQRVTLPQVGTFADGAAVRLVGETTFTLAQQVVDDMLLVSTDETCAAIKDIFEDTRTLPEPAGALSVAGLKKYVAAQGWQGKRLVAVVSGANINFDRLRHVAERAELGEGREMLLAVTIPERPGSFREFCHAIGNRTITEFNYRYADARDAQVFAGIKIANRAERASVTDELQRRGYSFVDLTDNEMAKLHLRHMVGGHAQGVTDEVLYRFMFPERPGALLHFLTSMSAGWNISLFHYRNHGSDFGRVLVGIQVPPAERAAFCEFLDKLGYQYWDETANPAYQRFLG